MCSSRSYVVPRRVQESTYRSVQSAASPVSSIDATRGARSCPLVVAARRTATGARSWIASVSTRANGSAEYVASAGSSAT